MDQYIQKHDINSLMESMLESLLRTKPQVRPKEHWAHVLRMEMLKSEGLEEHNLPEMEEASEVPGRLLIKLFEATKAITSEIVPSEAIRIIINETSKILECDRVSLFVYDKRVEMLVLNASNLAQPIRVKPGQGIAGHVFNTREVVNIPDCYADDRFDQTFDLKTGYRTKNLLAMPIVDFEGETMGVVQAINKIGDVAEESFSHVDEIVLDNLTLQISIALRNAEVYRAAIVTSERATALLRMMQSLQQDLGVQSTILTITMHANELVQADRCTVFLVDMYKDQLWSVSTDSGKEIRIPRSAGIAGECATEGKLIAIPDAYEDSRFNQEIDKKTGYRTQSILAIPILRRGTCKENESNTLAVIQMINKMEFDGEIGKFDDEDIQVMETFATFVASKLEGSSLLHTEKKRGSEASMAFGEALDHGDKSPHGKRQSLPSMEPTVTEGDEEEG